MKHFKIKAMTTTLLMVFMMSNLAFGQWDFTTNPPHMFNTNSGNIGIGTINPVNKLHIFGSNSTCSMGIRLEYLFTGPSNGCFGSSVWDINAIATGGDLHITNPTLTRPAIAIKQSGLVGIGTNAPQYKLDVAGTMRACEVKVDLFGGWCDYVFEEDYNLMSLATLEKYIKQHKHLPGIPSKMEVEEKGIALGEMVVNLLLKLEELTLYTIEQDKEIKRLQKEFEQLKQ